MHRYLLISSFILTLLLAGCAAATEEVVVKNDIPEPAAGEVAAFGQIRLVEEIKIYLPNEDQDGTLYLAPSQGDEVISISCSDKGDFGVYLPPDTYKVVRIDVGGYTFVPEIRLSVPAGYKAVYAGTIELDGTPAGVEAGTGESIFVYSILDESRQFMDTLRKQSPGSEREVVKSLFLTDGSLSTGSYPTKVFRAKDLQDNLRARTGAVEEVVSGGIIALTYVINPVWLFTLH